MTNILLIDAGRYPGPIDARACELDLIGAPHIEEPGGDHPEKSIRLILRWADSLEIRDVRLAFVDYRKLPEGATTSEIIREASERLGPIDIVCHPYSAPLSGDPHRLRNVALHLSNSGRPTEGPIEIASIGHDGPGQGRIPGLYASLIAIGMCDQNGERISDSGSISGAKPDLLVSAEFDIVGNPSITRYTGTSAGVCFVGAVAAKAMELAKDAGRSDLDPNSFVRLALRILNLEGLLGAPNPAKLTKRLIALSSHASIYLSLLRPEEVIGLNLPKDCLRAHVECIPTGGSEIPRYALEFHSQIGEAGSRPETVHTTFASLDIEQDGGQKLNVRVKSQERAKFALLVEAKGPSEWRRQSMPKRKQVTIVGISASHDASACVIVDGKILRAIQLERLTRRKHDGVPYLDDEGAVQYCLDSLGIKAADVDHFAFNVQPLAPGYYGLSQPTHSKKFKLFDPFSERAIYVSHHLAHAFSAYSLSGYRSALAIVADGSGGTVVQKDDLLCDGRGLQDYLLNTGPSRNAGLHVLSVYDFSKQGAKLTYRETAPSFNVRCGSASLGEAYAAVANYVFGSFHASGKVMGLAPYGDPEEIPTFLKTEETGQFPSFSNQWKNKYRDTEARSDKWKELVNLCARTQADFETGLLARLNHLLINSSKDVVYAGGLALNCTANAKLAAIAAKGFFVPSAASDCGVSLGAAYAADFLVRGFVHTQRVEHDYWGHPYSATDIRVAAALTRAWAQWVPYSAASLAKEIYDGAVVGWFDSASEFGPRALGHRSILADPRTRVSWERINRDVKYREDFRPFAPVVCQESASKFFELTDALPFMTQVCNVRSEFRSSLAAITHVDGTARVQTLSRRTNPELYDLLRHFETLSGFPILLNTSLNVQGEPICETPADALQALKVAKLDAMVFPQLSELARLRGLDHSSGVDVASFSLSFGVTLVAEASAHRTWYGFRLLHRDLRSYPLGSEEFSFIHLLCTSGAQLRDILKQFDKAQHLHLTELLSNLVEKRYVIAAESGNHKVR